MRLIFLCVCFAIAGCGVANPDAWPWGVPPNVTPTTRPKVIVNTEIHDRLTSSLALPDPAYLVAHAP